VPHLSLLEYILIAVGGAIAGALNAVAGGGSLISFPIMLGAGFSPVAANMTNTVALVPGNLGGSIGYRSELSGQSDRIRALGAVSIAGATIGSFLLIVGPTSVFRALVPWLILFSAALLALQPLAKRFIRSDSTTRRHRTVVLGGQFLTAIYGGYFGAGMGVVMLALFGTFLHDSLQRLNALKGLLALLINLMAAIYFALFGPVAWLPAVIMAASSLVGGHAGVRLARRMSDNVLRWFVIIFAVAVAVRLLV